MIELKQNTLMREIPSNLLVDKKVENMAATIQKSVDEMLGWIDTINYRTNLEDLPDDILEHLLWESHIKYYEGLALAHTRAQKINLIKQSTELHRLKGTPAAIEMVCELLNVNTQMQEWFEYDGDPYHFRISVMDVSERGLNEQTINLLEHLIMEYKNERSVLEAINIFFTNRHKPCVAATCFSGEEITLYPFVPDAIELRGVVMKVGVGNAEYETTTIYPR